MPFIGRGDFPHVEKSNNDGMINNEFLKGKLEYENMHRDYYYGFYYPMSKTEMFIQIVVSIIVLTAVLIMFLIKHRETSVDQFQNIKDAYMNTYIAIVTIAVAINILINFILKKGKGRYIGLSFLTFFSTISMIAFFIGNYDMVTKYSSDLIFVCEIYAILFVHLILNIMLICQSLKMGKISSRKAKLSRDDAILFDEEQNIKY